MTPTQLSIISNELHGANAKHPIVSAMIWPLKMSWREGEKLRIRNLEGNFFFLEKDRTMYLGTRVHESLAAEIELAVMLVPMIATFHV